MAVLTLTHQQKELLDRSVAAGEAADVHALVMLALAEHDSGIRPRTIPGDPGSIRRWRDDIAFTPSTERVVRWEHRLEPGTGRAVIVRAGQILRVAQVEGNQCADLNVFSLADYREAMHVGRTRTLHGIHPVAGDFLWSAPPRERAMMFILNDTAGLNDTLFPRCSANMYESMFGFADHTNCADMQAEAQREFGLTPDDVHDSFNLFMGTTVNDDGSCSVVHQQTSADDYVELLALMDVLAVPNTCGNDIFRTSNYALRPLDLTVMDAADDDLAAVPELRAYPTQRTPADFAQPHIRTERSLERDPDYVPHFSRTPIVTHEVSVELDAGAQALLDRHARRDLYGDDSDAALRDLVLGWWVDSHA
ncbi:urea carboxylase-associated family protein [Microbacterium sp. C7(2022)]|uniref:urea carboxylase-associated family protein n=1 Tax=Microbacterium sp. C7(2022) TaxID=2992759 RepID=UPI00237A2837|nr:urea carboxylase-associated family protein [Microbacterium sp. C7(2022)]MDE0547422.1 urea carboxylase-associated family protein [Microbacterium sp. C7(2022)]